jgi:hypothetical protein
VRPLWLLPVLALGFAVSGAWRWSRGGHARVAARAWLLLALIFGAVSLWLHFGPGTAA